MVSLNLFKLFKRKKEPKHPLTDSKCNGTKPSASAATEVSKVDKLSKNETPAKLQMEEPSQLQQANLKKKEEIARPIGEQVSGHLKNQNDKVDVVEPVAVEKQAVLKVVEDNPILNEVNVPDGTSVTEEIKEAKGTSVLEANMEAPVANGASQPRSISKGTTKENMPAVIDQADQSNVSPDTEILEQKTLNANLESKKEPTDQAEIHHEADENKPERCSSIQQIEIRENTNNVPVEIGKIKAETEKLLEPVQPTEQVEIPVATREAEIEADRSFDSTAATNRAETSVENDESLASNRATKDLEIPAKAKKVKDEADKALEQVETGEALESVATEHIENPAEIKEDKVEKNKLSKPVDATNSLLEEFLKNAENNVFPNEQSKEIFRSYKDKEIDEAAVIILLKEADSKAKSKSSSTNSKKNKKNTKKKGKKGKKK